MKHIKSFENIDQPQIGDYVECEDNTVLTPTLLHSFISNNIGRIENILSLNNLYPYHIRYENIPNEINQYFYKGSRGFNIEDIIEFAKTPGDIAVKINSKKYNL
jgi:hypothetical protein